MNLFFTNIDYITNNKFTFTPSSTYSNIKPITQSWGLCFYNNKMVIIDMGDRYHLPGGKIESGESPEQALLREIKEEINSTVLSFKLLGYQKVEYTNIDKMPHYQLRYFVKLNNIGNPHIDIATGLINKVLLIKLKDFKKFFPWGAIGDCLVNLVTAEHPYV